MKAMKAAKTAAIILSLAMIFSFMSFMGREKTYAMEIKEQAYLDLTGYQTNYAGPAAAAAYWFIKECMDKGLPYMTYVNENHELKFYIVDLDRNGDYDIKVSPQFDGGEYVIGLTLEKDTGSNLNDQIGLALDSEAYGKYEQMSGSSNPYGLQYFFKKIFFELESAHVEIQSDKRIELFEGSHTFEGLEGQAVHLSLDAMAEKGIIDKWTTGTITQGSFVTEYDLDGNGSNDIKETYKVDRSSNTISRLGTYGPVEEEFTVAATDELSAEMAQKTIFELQGVDHLYRSFIFSMVDPQQILPPPPYIYSLDGVKVGLSKSSFTYNGKVQKPAIKTIDGKVLTEGTDYETVWSNAASKKAGSYKITIKGIGHYVGETVAVYKINKASNKLSVKGKAVTVSFAKLKKSAKTFTASTVIKFTNKGQGKLTYKKMSGNSKIKVAKSTGKVTVKKGLKKGTYTVKVTVKAAGDANYKASSPKKVTITVKVR